MWRQCRRGISPPNMWDGLWWIAVDYRRLWISNTIFRRVSSDLHRNLQVSRSCSTAIQHWFCWFRTHRPSGRFCFHRAGSFGSELWQLWLSHGIHIPKMGSQLEPRIEFPKDMCRKASGRRVSSFPNQTEYRGDMPRGNKSFWASNWRQDQIEWDADCNNYRAWSSVAKCISANVINAFQPIITNQYRDGLSSRKQSSYCMENCPVPGSITRRTHLLKGAGVKAPQRREETSAVAAQCAWVGFFKRCADPQMLKPCRRLLMRGWNWRIRTYIQTDRERYI